jgi:hypothetical protein
MNPRRQFASTLLVLSLLIGGAAQADVSQSSALSARTLKDLYAFRVGNNHVLYYATLSGSSWSPWISFFDGAPLVNNVVAAVGTTGHLEVFAAGTDTHLYHDYFDGSSWHGWTRDFNGAPPLTSVSAASGPDGLMQVFGIGTDGTLVHCSLNQTWSAWVANFDGAPKLSNITEVNGATGHLEVFGVATDGTLVHDTYDGNWYGWDLGFDGAPRLTTVTAAMGPTSHLEVFGVGTDGTLFHDFLDSSWHGWSANYDGAPKLKSVEAMMGATGRLEVFGIGTDGTLVHDSLDTSWHGWTANFDGAPKLSAIAGSIGASGHLELFAAGSDGAMYHDYLDTSWHGWSHYNINSDWMGDLSGTIGGWAVNRVKLPGTHDSGTYAIASGNEVTSDAPSWLPVVQSLLGSAAGSVVAGWSKAQGWSIPYQLNAGIRYLDLRVCHASDGLRICHALAGDPIGTVIDAVAAFSANHPMELVILDFNHFYSMSAADHAALASRLSAALGSRLAPSSLSATATMSQLWSSGYNVIALYADSATVAANGFLWPQSSIASPWANTTSTSTLQSFITTQPLSRSGSSFFVSQGILTPDTNMIEQGLIPFTSNPGSLVDVANNLDPQLWNWLQTPAIHSQLNIVIADWQADWLIEDIQWLNTF